MSRFKSAFIDYQLVRLINCQTQEKELPVCRCCGQGRMHIVAVFHERGPPIWLSEIDQNAAACN